MQESDCDKVYYNGRPLSLTVPFVGIYHPIFAMLAHTMATALDQLKPRLTHEELNTGLILFFSASNFYKLKEEKI
jgi:hypothetical protein